MIKPVQHSQISSYILIPEEDYTRNVEEVYDEKGNPAYKAEFLSQWQWEEVEENEEDESVTIVITPTFQEAAKKINNNRDWVQWRSLADPVALCRVAVVAPLEINEGDLDPYLDNLGDGVTYPYMLATDLDQLRKVAEPIPSEINK